MEDKFGAMIRPDITLTPLGAGVLSGMTFAAKDNIDVARHVTSAGNPDWLKTHEAADHHADVIVQLLWAGARLTGKTHTDELMFSLNGENYHYGTPKNPRGAGRIPGGSSSGSAVAVAGDLTDFALGTDTGGSVRIPSSYCGIYGIRPTHGRISTEGVIKLAPSFCTVGWMARSASVLATVGSVLTNTQPGTHYAPYTRCVVATDVLSLVEPGLQQSMMSAMSKIHGVVEKLEFEPVAEDGLDLWLWVFRTLQAWEIWQTHGDWIQATEPTFGPGVTERFAWAASVTPEMEGLARRLRQSVSQRILNLLGEDAVLLIPTAPGPAPIVNWGGKELDDWRTRALRMTCIAGLAGLPQVTIPCMTHEGLPVGLSLVGGPNDDMRLLRFVEALSADLTGES